RPYRSPLRAERSRATRERILRAALERFLRDGYVATSMRSIGAAAGVSERTVYLAFPSKPELLGELIRVAVRGGAGDAPLAARAEWKAVVEAPGEEILERFAAESTRVLERTAHIIAMADAAMGAAP